ncbi:hypothetical protein [Flavonifractor sp. An10]|nr:hypothetical protein [Flavonifractor sp. An10]
MKRVLSLCCALALLLALASCGSRAGALGSPRRSPPPPSPPRRRAAPP